MAYTDPYDATWRRQQEAKFAAWQKSKPVYVPLITDVRNARLAVFGLCMLVVGVIALLHYV